jgi:hypothetical protein
MRRAAEALVKSHNEFFTDQWWSTAGAFPGPAGADARLRLTALSHIGNSGSGGPQDLRLAIAGRMREIVPRLVGCPEFGGEQHKHWLTHTELEMQLRGWETLLLALNEPTRSTLADVMYAYRMATEPILPPTDKQRSDA